MHAAIARLESFCHTVGPLDPGDVTAAMAIAQVELDRAVSVLKRLPPP